MLYPFNFLSCLKVDTAVMRSQASVAKSQAQNLQSDFAAITGTVKDSAKYWIGESADAYRSQYIEKEEDISKILMELMRDIDKLYDMATQYDIAEGRAGDIATSLPGDVIQ